jgi:hypothetical protein
LKKSCLSTLFGIQGYNRTNRIPVALRAAQAKDNAIPNALHCTAEKSNLRPGAISQQYFNAPIMIEVGERNSLAVIAIIQS